MNSSFQFRVGPTRRAMPAACTSVGADKAIRRVILFAPIPAQAADMARTGTESVSSFDIFYLLGLVLLECIFVS